MLIESKVKSLIRFWSLWPARLLSILSSCGCLAAHMFDVYCFDRLTNIVTVELVFRVFSYVFAAPIQTCRWLMMATPISWRKVIIRCGRTVNGHILQVKIAANDMAMTRKFLRIHSYDDEYVSTIPIRYHTQQQRICLWLYVYLDLQIILIDTKAQATVRESTSLWLRNCVWEKYSFWTCSSLFLPVSQFFVRQPIQDHKNVVTCSLFYAPNWAYLTYCVITL